MKTVFCFFWALVWLGAGMWLKNSGDTFIIIAHVWLVAGVLAIGGKV